MTDMDDQFRSKVDQYSSKSPRGSRSPTVSRQDTTGTLKTTISLGKNPSIVHSGPFYLMKEPPGESELTGAVNLMAYYGLEHAFSKLSGKRLKQSLSACLPHLPGHIDVAGNKDNSSLRSLIEKPPVCGKEIIPLNGLQMSGFRLHAGSLPDQYRNGNQIPPKKHKSKHKKNKYKISDPITPETTTIPNDVTTTPVDTHEKKHKKQKRHDEDKEQRKKRKKEKKKKKQKYSPEHTAATGNLTPNRHS